MSKIKTSDHMTPNIAEIEISYKTRVKFSERELVTQSYKAAELFKGVFDMNTIEHRESMYTMYMNRANKVLGVLLVSTGAVSGTVCDPKIIFQGALRLNASGFIVCHNHPSGTVKPSEQDLQMARKLRDGAKLLDMSCLDFMIITAEDGYTSFADEGLF